jgi:argininosuccinate lyase
VKMWGGRFDKETDLGFLEFSSSASFDAMLYPYDIKCTRAWMGALVEIGVITNEEEDSIASALDRVFHELDSGSFSLHPTDEDIHTAIERRLVEIAGPVGGKIRTGRSRNDQVATDMRMMVKEACARVAGSARDLQSALIAQAESYIEVVVPGHTHLQQAQPVLFAHALLAYVQMLERDIELLSTAANIADVLPLGSGAIAGSGFLIDRQRLADDLGFSRVSENSMDAVSDRDFVAAALFAFSMVMIHLSRLAEQLIIWCSQEFGLVRLDDAWSTGSSLMPQKKNPDGAELVRGKTGRVLGALVAMLTMLKGLPLTYNRDLQEDKEGFFDALDTAVACLRVMEGTIRTMTVDATRAAECLSGGFMTATDLADYLVSKGMEFPEAHRVVGEVVAFCMREGKDLGELQGAELQAFSELIGSDASGWTTPEASVARRSIKGGTAREAVEAQLKAARDMISGGGNSV